MILYIVDNLLKVDRVLKLNDHHYCPAREDGLPTMEFSIDAVRTLMAARLQFIIEIGARENAPESFKTLMLKPHPDAKEYGVNWVVPPYWNVVAPMYDLEYKTAEDELKYKTGLTLAGFEKAIAAGVRVTRVFSENGLTAEFLEQFKLRILMRGKFRYAVPQKKEKDASSGKEKAKAPKPAAGSSKNKDALTVKSKAKKVVKKK